MQQKRQVTSGSVKVFTKFLKFVKPDCPRANNPGKCRIALCMHAERTSAVHELAEIKTLARINIK